MKCPDRQEARRALAAAMLTVAHIAAGSVMGVAASAAVLAVTGLGPTVA